MVYSARLLIWRQWVRIPPPQRSCEGQIHDQRTPQVLSIVLWCWSTPKTIFIWCCRSAGPGCHTVTVEIAGSNPVSTAMEEFICKYCGKECKNKNSLAQHEIRCKQNPNRIECKGNNGNMPAHTSKFLEAKVVMRNGDVLDITNKELLEYRETHVVCEICGRPIEDCVKWDSKFAPKNLSIDHDHNTNKFRGLLCSLCNRQLGWYEKYKQQIENYLNK